MPLTAAVKETKGLCAGAQLKHLRFDHRFMTQITSSAIWNGPSPDGYVSMLNRTNTAGRLSQRTHEKLLRIFAARPPPQEPKPQAPALLTDPNGPGQTELTS